MTLAHTMPAFILCAFPAIAQVNVLTYHNDLARTGQNLNETILTPANVNAARFGLLFNYPVDGQIYAQPLYVSGLSIAGRGLHNVVFVATEHDSVYAFDADGGGLLWHDTFVNPAEQITSIPSPMYTNCTVLEPEIGITGTPVIDLAAGTLYVVASTLESQSNPASSPYLHRLHALDITTGAERLNSPVVIQAQVPGTADWGRVVAFRPDAQLQRAGLALSNGVVYVAWSSHCDSGPYHGWIMGYDAVSLRQAGSYNNTANGNAGSFWQSGAAPAFDAAGNLYAIAANGDFDANTGGTNLGESVIKLSTRPQLSAADYFTPFNVSSLDGQDLDLGSSGALLLPDEAGSTSHPHLLVSAGKEGRIYVLDRDDLGHFQPSSDSQIVQSLIGAIQPLFGIPAYFNKTVYFAGQNDALKAFSVGNGMLSSGPVSQSASTVGYLGAVPSVSANGSSGGIVWLIDSGASLRAYDASNVSRELYAGEPLPGSGSQSGYVKFSTPTVANGKVYAGLTDRLAVFGLLAAPRIASVSSAASFEAGAAAPGSLVSVFGVNLAAPLMDSSLLVNGAPAPLLYSSPGQLNAQVPFSAPIGMAQVVAMMGGVPSSPAWITILKTAPSLFSVVLDVDGTVNGPKNPAMAGTYLSAFLTGLGAVDSPDNASLSITATLGNQPCPLQFAALAPGLIGVYQVNLQVPPSLGPGEYALSVAVSQSVSNAVAVTIR